MPITKKAVASKIAAYLHHEISSKQLVAWAEEQMMDGEVVELDAAVLGFVLARLGVADVKAFGLSWEDCGDLLGQLGYAARVDVVAA